jgi:CheY-like chemotaxis protein
VPHASPPSTSSIAIIDDDEDVRLALDDLLRSCGFVPTLFENGTQFLLAHARADVDCIVSDVRMPGCTGLDVARRARRNDTPVILMTAYATPDVRQQAEAARVQRLLIKPFEASELIREVTSALGRRP